MFQGYVLVPRFFTDEELQPVIEAINGLVDEVAERLYKAGKITSKRLWSANRPGCHFAYFTKGRADRQGHWYYEERCHENFSKKKKKKSKYDI